MKIISNKRITTNQHCDHPHTMSTQSNIKNTVELCNTH